MENAFVLSSNVQYIQQTKKADVVLLRSYGWTHVHLELDRKVEAAAPVSFHRVKDWIEHHPLFYQILEVSGDLMFSLGSIGFIVGSGAAIRSTSTTDVLISSAGFLAGSVVFVLASMLRICSGCINCFVLHNTAPLSIADLLSSFILLLGSIGFVVGSALFHQGTVVTQASNLMLGAQISWLIGSVLFIGNISYLFFLNLYLLSSSNPLLDFRTQWLRAWSDCLGGLLYWLGAVFFLIGAAAFLGSIARSFVILGNAFWICGAVLFVLGCAFRNIAQLDLFERTVRQLGKRWPKLRRTIEGSVYHRTMIQKLRHYKEQIEQEMQRYDGHENVGTSIS